MQQDCEKISGSVWHIDSRRCQVSPDGKTSPIWRAAVRETGVSRRHGTLPLATPLTLSELYRIEGL